MTNIAAEMEPIHISLSLMKRGNALTRQIDANTTASGTQSHVWKEKQPATTAIVSNRQRKSQCQREICSCAAYYSR